MQRMAVFPAEQELGAPATSFVRRIIVVFEASATVDGHEHDAYGRVLEGGYEVEVRIPLEGPPSNGSEGGPS